MSSKFKPLKGSVKFASNGSYESPPLTQKVCVDVRERLNLVLVKPKRIHQHDTVGQKDLLIVLEAAIVVVVSIDPFVS